MGNKILFVDDVPHILDAFRRSFHNRYNMETALGPEAGLTMLQTHGPFAVVVSDLKMPGMDGNEFLDRIRELSPHTVRIMLTGYADLKTALSAVNEGYVFRFLTKPCPGKVLTKALDEALEQYQLVVASSGRGSTPTTGTDAKVRFVMNKSGMKVGISQYIPPVEDGRPLSPDSILKQLREAGIVADLNLEMAQKACDILQSGGDAKRVVIAEGRPATEPQDAAIDFAGDPNFPVLPGMVIGKVRLAVPGSSGMTADGRVLESQSARTPNDLKIGDYIQFDSTDSSLKSSAYGLVRIQDGKVEVEPLLRVSSHSFIVSPPMHPIDFIGRPLSTTILDDELKRLGVVLPPQPTGEPSAQKQNDTPAQGEDARVRFVMNKTGMKVGISQYFQPVGEGRPLSPELILKQLHDAGIKAELNVEISKKACEILLGNGDVKRLVIAEGRPALEPQDAYIDYSGDQNAPVLPGMNIGKVRPTVQASKGMAVDGRVLDPQSNRVARDLKIGENLHLDTKDSSLNALVYGFLRIREGEIMVESLLKVSPDNSQVSCVMHPVDFHGQSLTIAMFDEELKRLGIVLPLLTEEIESALDKAVTTKTSQDAIIVQATPPSPGQEGRLELLVKVRETAPVLVDGKIDYSERGTFPSVEAGMPLAVVHPSSRSGAGTDIYGKPYPAKEGKTVEVIPGENVELLPDGVTYAATAPGMLVFEKNTLSVTDCLEVKRDVGFATGDIRVGKGSVKIRGAVSKGFQVSAPGHVIVEGVIESAKVEAGGDVQVRGGILMPGGGEVRAGGNVVAQYAINSRIIAGGDVIIAKEASNSTIHAGGKFIATKGAGIVHGCEIVSGAGIHVNELGSALGTHTLVAISAKSTQNTELLEEKGRLRRKIRQIDETFGKASPEEILAQTPTAKRRSVAGILQIKELDQERLQEIIKILAAEQEESLRAMEEAKITVKGIVYPGVTVKFGSRALIIRDSVSNAKFFYERQSGGVSVTSG